MGVGCAALAAAACAGTPPPKEQVAQAEQAIARAQQEQVAIYAPLPMRQSQEKLDRAKDLMRDGNNTEARRQAEQATVDAQLAMATAQKAKTEKSVSELGRTVDMIQREVK